MNTIAAHHAIRRHPIAFSTLVVATAGTIEVVLSVAHDLLPFQLSVLTVGILSGAVLSLLGGLTISRLDLWRELGLVGRPARARTLLWFLPFVIFGLLPLTQGFEVTPGRVAAAVAFGVLIAFWKLTVLGLLLHALLHRGARSGAALAAAFWAGMHAVFGILTGAFVTPTLVLALSYLFLSFAFIAVRLRTSLLWPLVGSYALLLATASAVQTDDASNLADSVQAILPALGVSVLLAVYGLAAWPRRRRAAVQQPGLDRSVETSV